MRPFRKLSRWMAAATTGAAVCACAHSAGKLGAAADPRRDMVTVLAAPAPHPSLGRQADLFGRFVGTWDADYSFIAEDGSVRHKRGEVLFGWVLDGHALQDIFLSYPDSGSSDERKMVTGVRWVDPKSGRWTLAFVAPTFDVIIRMEGGAEGDRIVLRGQDSKGVQLRWSFNDIQPDSFVWRGESSRDGGRTWRLEEEHHMRRRGPSRSGGTP
jgi:hypothetical protein